MALYLCERHPLFPPDPARPGAGRPGFREPARHAASAYAVSSEARATASTSPRAAARSSLPDGPRAGPCPHRLCRRPASSPSGAAGASPAPPPPPAAWASADTLASLSRQSAPTASTVRLRAPAACTRAEGSCYPRHPRRPRVELHPAPTSRGLLTADLGRRPRFTLAGPAAPTPPPGPRRTLRHLAPLRQLTLGHRGALDFASYARTPPSVLSSSAPGLHRRGPRLLTLLTPAPGASVCAPSPRWRTPAPVARVRDRAGPRWRRRMLARAT
ncbi:hypothetical protein ACRAWF_43655 [Streptomyces sp. L7]